MSHRTFIQKFLVLVSDGAQAKTADVCLGSLVP
jgi:hypothetical protein